MLVHARHSFSRHAALAALALLAACSGGDGGTAPVPPAPALAWAAPLDSLEEGTTLAAGVTGGPATYTVSDPALATISGTGELTARGLGTVTVTATRNGQSISRPVRLVPSPLGRLQLTFTQPAAEVFTLDDTARALEAIVTRRNGRVVTDSVPVSITLRGEMTPHGAGVLALDSVQNGIVRIRPARKGYWRGWAVVTAGTLRDSVPLRSTGFLARFIYEPTTAPFPASPLARAVADSAFRVWARHIIDTMPRRNLLTDSVRFGLALNLFPERAAQLANEDRLVIFTIMNSFGGETGVFGLANGARHDANEARATVGTMSLNTAIASDRTSLVATIVHELGHILGIGDHPVWTARGTAATRADGTTGRVLNLPNALADLRAAGGGLPAYLTGIPVSRDGGHLVDVVAANDIMADRAPITNVVTTASLLILRDLGYRIDLAGAVPAQGRANPAQGW